MVRAEWSGARPWRRVVAPAKRVCRRFGPRTIRTSAEVFDTEYLSADWERLDAITEVAHYMTILGYLAYGVDRPRTLDLGCGHGRLLQLLARFGFSDYLGVDFSKEAITLASGLGIGNAQFEVSDFDTWDTDLRFDAVVFNECLYYSREPALLFERAARWLAPDGMLVVSMFRKEPITTRIWSQIAAMPVEVLAGTTVADEATGCVWEVKALRPQGHRAQPE